MEKRVSLRIHNGVTLVTPFPLGSEEQNEKLCELYSQSFSLGGITEIESCVAGVIEGTPSMLHVH